MGAGKVSSIDYAFTAVLKDATVVMLKNKYCVISKSGVKLTLLELSDLYDLSGVAAVLKDGTVLTHGNAD